MPCSSFFFDGIRPEKDRTLTTLLRSVAYQMARSNHYVREKLVELERSGSSTADVSSIVWQTLFGQAILRADSRQRQFWVIDALEQCEDASALQKFLQKLKAVKNLDLRIFVTSQRTPELSELFDSLSACVEEKTMSKDITTRDIRVFLHGKRLPITHNSDQAKKDFIDDLVKRSGGNFLWASTILPALEDTYSTEGFQAVLDSVPDDMDTLYKVSLKAMAEKITKANKPLAKSILTWAVCAKRPLTLEELVEALDFDRGKDRLVVFIEKSFRHLLHIDELGRVDVAHHAVRVFLTKRESDFEFAINKVSGHSRLAKRCLRCLTGPSMIRPAFRRRQNRSAAISEKSKFLSYACTSFSAHLEEADPHNKELIGLLNHFLDNNMLSWIELVASDKESHDLSHLISAARNLQAYRKNSVSESSTGDILIPRAEESTDILQKLDHWTTDIVQLVARFGKNLRTYPFSIYYLIPPLCPKESQIYKTFGAASRGLVLKGMCQTIWDDRISCINFSDGQASAVTSRGIFFAIGLDNDDGSIILFSRKTYQEVWRTSHGEKVTFLQFADPPKYLISAGSSKVRCWNIKQQDPMWTHHTAEPTIGLGMLVESANGPAEIMLVDRGNRHARISLEHGSGDEVPSIALYEPGQEIDAERQPSLAIYSDEMHIFAIAYRGQKIGLWDTEVNSWMGYLDKSDGSGKSAPVIDMVFHPQRDTSILAACFLDSELVLFDVPSGSAIYSIPDADAHGLAASPDGQTLVAYCTAGTKAPGRIVIYSFGRTLHRMRIIPCDNVQFTSLAFGSDGHVFFDIGENQCNVWQPTVLVRKDVLDLNSESSDGSISPIKPTATGFDEDPIITAVAFDAKGDFVFCGKANGYVGVFRAITGAEVNDKLYSHDRNVTVTGICVCQTKIASVDTAGRFLVHKISRTREGWQLTDRSLVLDHREKSQVSQILFWKNGSLLIVSTLKDTIIYDVSEKGEEPYRKSIGGATWREHPQSNDKLIMHNGSGDQVFNSSLSEADDKSSIILYKSVEQSHRDSDSGLYYMLWDLAILAKQYRWTDPEPHQSFQWLCLQYELIIGLELSKLRIVFMDWDKWICTIDLEGFKRKTFKRHFFIPYHWLSPARSPLLRVSSTGMVILAEGENLISIANGLDDGVEDKGAQN